MKKILIVDDDRDFAEGIGDILELNGHEVILAFSGKKALEIVKNETVDIVFMDIRMPRMNGVETTKKLKNIAPDIRIVMMTGYSDKTLRDQAINNGALSILNKPVDIKELLAFIGENGVENVILLVDDDEDFSTSLKSILVEQKYIVHIARSGQEAINYVLNNKVTLLLMDLRLTGANGLDIYKTIKAKVDAPPAFIVTAYSKTELEQIEEFNTLSVDKVFQKPFSPEDLIKAIKEQVS